MSRMIIIPAKKAHEVNVAYPLKQFIQRTYTTNLDDYLKSADSLNQLRNEALFKSNRQDKLNKLTRYLDQLTAIETKLPISENQIHIPFKYHDAFEKGLMRSSFTLSSNLYERLCILFNIGSCCSEVAANQQYDQEDGLKTAIKLYQLAAGAFSFIRDNSLSATRNDCTTDLHPETASVLTSIMLAQAQEVFYLKGVKDKIRDLTISKIVSQCSDFYADAMKSIQNEMLRDIQKQWLPILAGKQALYHAMAEFHRAEHESNEKNIGEALSRLTKALELVKVAEQRSNKELNIKQQLFQIQSAYDRVKKDNEFVYHDRVPDYKLLSAIERATLAKSTPIKFPISDDFRDLFSSLVPITVHNGLQIFKGKKMETINLEIGKLRQATELLNTALAAWNLPAAIEDVSGLNKVPQSLLDKSQIIKDKGGIAKIDSLMAELPPLLQRNREMLDETKNSLDDEERSDNELRDKLKQKWRRTPSRQLNEYLYSEIKQYEQIMENAIKANKVIESKYSKNRDCIQLLSKPTNEISSSLPAATPVAALQNTHIIKDLRRLMEEVEALKNVREVIETELKSLDSDALTAKLVSALQNSSSLDEHSIINNELDELIGPFRKQVRESIQEQEKLLGYIEKANSEFAKEKTQNETSKLRDEMLKNLATASDSFNELFNHLEEGIKFYNDLTPILLKFQTKVNDFVLARKTEKDDLMREIQEDIVRPQSSTRQAPPRPPQPETKSTDTKPSSESTASASAAALHHPPENQQQTYPQYPNPYYPMVPSPYYSYIYPNQQGQQPAYPQAPQLPPYPQGQAPYPQQPYYPPGMYPPQVPPRK